MQAQIIQSKSVADAMRKVDRKEYCGGAWRSAYDDKPLSIGFNATISAPHMHAYCLDYMSLELGMRVLDVGSGSGYLTACMSLLVGENGAAFGVEHIKDLATFSRQNISRDQPDLKNWEVINSDGRLGLKSEAPFDAIHVGAAASEVPDSLLRQLKIGGVLVIPVGQPSGNQSLYVIKREAKDIFTRKDKGGVRYVPLTDAKSQLR